MTTQSLSNMIDPPPRLTGDSAHDTVSVIQWLNAFYVKGVLSGGLLQTQNFPTTLAEQFDALFTNDYPSLAAMAALVGEADKLAYYTSGDTFDLTVFTAFARTLLDDIDANAARATLGAGDVNGPGSSTANHVAVFDGTTGKVLKDGGAPAGDVVGPAGATGNNVALFDGATGKLIKDGGALGSGAYATAYTLPTATAVVLGGVKPDGTSITNTSGAISVTYPLTAAPGTAAYQNVGAFDPAGAAAAVTPTTLGLVIGTNVQAYDADLTTWAWITPGANVGTALAVAVGTDGAFVVKGGVLGTPSSGTVTNLTGTASININGTVGATTATTGKFTTIEASAAIKPNSVPSTDWGIDFAARGTESIADTATYDLASGSGLVVLHCNNTGEAALYLCWAGNVTKMGGSGNVVSGAPAAGQIGLYYNGGTAKYRIENQQGAARDLYITTIKTRTYT